MSTIEVDPTTPPDIKRKEWLVDRRVSGIGASESAVVLGVSKWKSAYELWAEKRGVIEPDDLSENEAVEWGLRLEPVIAQAFAERSGREVKLAEPYTLQRSPKFGWLIATPDAYQPSGLVQIKTAGAFKARDWAEEPPLEYVIQVQHEMAVTGAELCTLVALIGGQKLVWFDVERNDRFIEAMIPQLAEFWACVKGGIAPIIDGSLAASQALAKLHPKDNGEVVELPGTMAEWAERLEAAKDKIKAWEAEARLADNHLREAIGDATIGRIAGYGSYSLKTQTVKEHVRKESTFRVLRKLKE